MKKVLKILRIAGGQFSRQKPREKTLSKIRQKILNMSLHHIEPGSEAAKKFDNFDVFWDTLTSVSDAALRDVQSFKGSMKGLRVVSHVE